MRGKYGRRGRSDKRTARELLAREDRQRLLLIDMFVRAGGRALDTFIAVSGRAAIEAVSAPRMWPDRGSRGRRRRRRDPGLRGAEASRRARRPDAQAADARLFEVREPMAGSTGGSVTAARPRVRERRPGPTSCAAADRSRSPFRLDAHIAPRERLFPDGGRSVDGPEIAPAGPDSPRARLDPCTWANLHDRLNGHISTR